MEPKPAPRSGVLRALNRKQLVLFYQPVHDLQSRRIVAAEALLRARRSSGEIRSAVPIAYGAEAGPEMFRLDSWMMRQAVRDAAEWGDVRLNVNLAPREFEEGKLRERLEKLGDVSRLNVEIIETTSIRKPERLRDTVDAVRALGVQIWLDDFGTGHSTLSHLLLVEASGVKVPETFIKGVEGSARCRAIVRSIVSLAHELQMTVIAEGVENDAQLAFLRDLGCECVQGFLFSEPMEAEDFTAALARSSTQ